MYTLRQQREAIDNCELIFPKHILIWGSPRSGKTHLAATALQSPYIDKVYWFDLEKGLETVLYATKKGGSPLLSPDQLDKLIPFHLSDTTEYPIGAETILRTFRPGTSKPTVCQDHGKVECRICPRPDQVSFNLKDCGPKDLVVIETGSQLADSVLSVSLNRNDYKDLRKYYGDFTLDMIPIVTAIQAANTNIIMTTHDIDLTKTVKDPFTKSQQEQLIEILPLCGSRNFSKKIGKYFNYLIYTYNENINFKTSTRPGQVAKVNRVGLRRKVSTTDDTGQPTLAHIFNPKAKEEAAPTGPTVKLG